MLDGGDWWRHRNVGLGHLTHVWRLVELYYLYIFDSFFIYSDNLQFLLMQSFVYFFYYRLN